VLTRPRQRLPGRFLRKTLDTTPPAGGSAPAVTRTSRASSATGAGASGVAETRLSALGTGAASASEEIVTLIAWPELFLAQVTFSFSATPFLQVAVDQPGDASAAIMSLDVRLTNAAGNTVFLWTPGLSSGEVGVASETDPFSLNQALLGTRRRQHHLQSWSGNFSATSVNLRATCTPLAPDDGNNRRRAPRPPYPSRAACPPRPRLAAWLTAASCTDQHYRDRTRPRGGVSFVVP
jgi:hypothetical protein